MARCAICFTKIRQDEAPTECEACRQPYHDSCWQELGGCGTYGCEAAVLGQKAEPAQTSGGWGDSKNCPACNTLLVPSAMLCYCGARYPYPDPMTPAEYQAWRKKRSQVTNARTLIVLLLIGALLGLTGPVLGIIAGVYTYRKRHLLAGGSGGYLAMGYGAGTIGVLYSVIVILALAGL